MDIFTIYGRNYDSNVYIIIGNIPTIIDTGTGLYNKEIMDTSHPVHAIKLCGFPLEGKKTPLGDLNKISIRFISQLKSCRFVAWIG